MIAVVEHKDYIRRVRDDLAESMIACVHCRGRGARSRCIGQIGNFSYYGWQLNGFADFACVDCDGRGAWALPSTNGETAA